MTADPGDETAAGRGQLRASRADREQVIGTLKAAFVQGMLARDEFDQRVSRALTPRTYTELAALTADLPAGLTMAQHPRLSHPQNEPMRHPGRMVTIATVLCAGAWAYGLFLSPHQGDNPWTPPLLFGGFLVYIIVLLVGVVNMVVLFHEKRSGRQPSSGR